MKIEFRFAKREDLPDIISITDECFSEYTELSYAQKLWDQFKDDPNQIYINGYLQGQIVAHVKLTIIPTIYQPMETYAMINHLCVKPEARRHHIGTHILEYCKKVALERGCVELSLWSKNFRVPAHALYQKFGFEIVDAKFFTYDLRGEKL